MSKLGFWVAVSVVSLGAAVGAWYYKYQLYGWLPSTASSELKNVDGLLMDKEGKPFTGRVKDISDSGYSLYAYKDGKLDGLNVVFSEGQLREIGHWENGEQNGLFEAWGSSSKTPVAKPDGTKMFCSAFLNDVRMCCFFANTIVKY